MFGYSDEPQHQRIGLRTLVTRQPIELTFIGAWANEVALTLAEAALQLDRMFAPPIRWVITYQPIPGERYTARVFHTEAEAMDAQTRLHAMGVTGSHVEPCPEAWSDFRGLVNYVGLPENDGCCTKCGQREGACEHRIECFRCGTWIHAGDCGFLSETCYECGKALGEQHSVRVDVRENGGDCPWYR